MKKVLKKVGESNLHPRVKESVEKCIPRSKVVMGRAKRGLYAGRHIQFGNSVSEDGGNKFVALHILFSYLQLLAFFSFFFFYFYFFLLIHIGR